MTAPAPHDITIREFRWPDDYDAARALWQRSGVYIAGSDGPEQIAEVCRRNPGLVLVAVAADGALVGSVIGTFDGRRAYLYHVAVDPTCRRSGLGRRLMAVVEARLWALGAPKIRFMVMADNADATAFYRALGYAPDTHAFAMSKSRPAEAPA